MDRLNLRSRYDAVDEDIPFDEPNLIRVGKKLGDRMMTGFVNINGIEVVPCEYITREYRLSCGLLSLYDSNMKIGFINNKGDFIYRCQFDEASGFKDNLCGVSKYDGGVRKWGLIDNRGNLLINYKYSAVVVLGNNRILIEDAYLTSVGGGGKGCGMMDYSGNVITSLEYRQMGPLFSDGTLEYVHLNGEHGIMDINGNHLEVLPY